MGAQRRRKNVVSAARRSSRDRVPVFIGLAVVLALAAAVAVVVALTARDRSAQTAQPIPAVTAPPDSVPVTLDRESGTVVAGQEDAPVVINVYEDFLCPACGAFEERYGQDVHERLTNGSLRVRYHLVNLLDQRSDPPGYSLTAANAALGVASHEPQAFLDFHTTLMRHMPPEHSRPYNDDQLIDLARRLGVTADAFAAAVRDRAFADAVRSQLEAARNDPALKRQSGDGQSHFGTPTVTHDGRVLDVFANQDWLTDLTESLS
ncbi:DsbA family protein [Lentzea sp. NEAU-D7]|uniref:DsbA family protein n=1 Tax=Lentzea sp. NEAU-D7 TaxID=2994667 RepID=UPI00224AD1E5|nr:thioredoxin domain-containing protein [Lentzea sp. NEAU-D7]MCX2948870.1 thioredoxin domain-containing protein [Lentzea sp. NEAU-D7]